MEVLYFVFACFMLLATVDRIIGNRLGLGKEMEKGVMLLGTMTLSMVGMIVLSPVIAELLLPVLEPLNRWIGLEPSVIMGSLFANDMGGAPLSLQTATSETAGYFNGLVVASMLGATVSFTIPLALGVIDKKHHKDVALCMLCGIITIPIGCLVSGLILRMSVGELLRNLIPLAIFSGIIAVCLGLWQKATVKVFTIFGKFVQILVAVGLAIGLFTFLTDITVLKNAAPLMDGMNVVINATAVMTGAFPLIWLLSKLLKKPLIFLGKFIGINDVAAMGLVGCLATNVTTIGMVDGMNRKGIVLNMAFAVSGAFVFAGHLAFTVSMNPDYLLAVIIGKLVGGITAVILANFVFSKAEKNTAAESMPVEAQVEA